MFTCLSSITFKRMRDTAASGIDTRKHALHAQCELASLLCPPVDHLESTMIAESPSRAVDEEYKKA